MGLTDLAIESYKREKDFKENEVSYKTGTHLNDIGVFYKRDEKYDSAFYYFKKSIKVLTHVKENNLEKDIEHLNIWIGLAKGNLGECYLENKEYEKAIPLFLYEEKESKIFFNKSIWDGLEDFWADIASCYIHTDKLSLAKKYIDSLRQKNNRLYYYKLKYEYFQVLKKYDSANYYNVKYNRISDSLFKDKKEKRNLNFLKLLEFQEKAVNQQYKINDINKENKANEKRIQTNLIFIFILTIASLLLFYFLIKFKKQKKLIEFQNKSINKALSEKSVLLSELHHRVKNNLQMMTSILNLQQNKLKSDELKDTFQYSINRISTISKVHNKLFNNKSLTKISLNNYINNIVNELKTIYPNFKTVDFNINVQEGLYIHIDQTQALGLIVNELLTNTYKHAFLDKNNSKINLSISEKNDIIYFSYSDNGVGFDLNSINKKSSIGIVLIERLANQLEANAIFESKNGMSVSFSFKNKFIS